MHFSCFLKYFVVCQPFFLCKATSHLSYVSFKRDSYETPGDNITEVLSHTTVMWWSLREIENPNTSAAQARAREIRRVFTHFDFVPKRFPSLFNFILRRNNPSICLKPLNVLLGWLPMDRRWWSFKRWWGFLCDRRRTWGFEVNELAQFTNRTKKTSYC